MTLQSQSFRSSMPHSSQSLGRLRRRGQRRLLGMGLLVLLVGGGFIYLVQHRDGGGASGLPNLGPQSAKADSGTAPSKPGVLAPAPDPIAQKPAAKPTPPAPALDLEMASKRPATAGGLGQPSGGMLIPKGPIPSETATSAPTTTPPQPVSAPNTAPATAPTTTTVHTPSPAPAAPPASGPTTPPSSAGTVSNPLLPLPGVQTPTPVASNSTPANATPGASTPAQPTAPAALEVSGAPADIAASMAAAERFLTDRKPVDARTQLNKVLLDPRTSAKDREGLRRWVAQLNQDLVFSPTVYGADPIAESYKVVSNDNLVKIARKEGAITESSLIGRVNRLVNPNALQIGQSLKIVKGPFHAVVSKSAFRMDVYQGPTPSPTSLGTSGLPDGVEPGWTFICSFPVGLGEKGATPLANFSVKENKLVDPTWANPRTGEKFSAADPKNPIGERWIGLAGLDDRSKGYSGYGIHGTIQPESIGNEMSMGCVRMKADDVEIVYELLMPKVSVVKIVP